MNYIRTLPCIWILYLMKTCTAHENNSTLKASHARLIDHLMHGYNKGVRPVQDWRKATDVYVDLLVYAILGVNEKEQLITTYIWYYQSWLDEFLTWDPEEFDNVTKISVPVSWIWVPDIMVMELVDAGKLPEDSYVYIDFTGKVYNNKPFQIQSTCTFDIYYFPFDHHNCSITFTSWTHTTQDINVYFWRHKSKKTSYTSKYVNDSAWNILKVYPRNVLFEYGTNGNFGETVFYIILKRKPLFYIVNLILPSMFLMFMNIVGFYIPPEKGERTSFKITLFLGYSVFLLIVADASPPIGTPLIGSYFVMGMVLIVLSVMESIFISRLVHQQELNRAVPKWVKTLVLEKMATYLCLKNNDPFITSCNDASSDVSEQKENSSTEKLANYNDGNMKHDGQLSTTQDSEVLLRVLKEIVSFRECLKKNTHQCNAREWLHVGYIIDTFLFRIYVLIILLYVTSMTVIWAQ